MIFSIIYLHLPAECSQEKYDEKRGGKAKNGAGTVDKEVIRAIAREMYELGEMESELTEAEIELLSRYPEEMVRLAQIADYARTRAGEAHREDPDVPEDAYRHVLWSCLLTKEYGEKFAEEVTDAHETGDTGDTQAEHEMDYANNAAGRRYALMGYDENDILERVIQDHKAIKRP